MRAATPARPSASEGSVGIALSVASLQWALGIFLAAAGAMMLVAPHQFGAPGYDALRRHLPWWGVSFCFSGAGLLAARVFALPRWLLLVTHLAAAVALALLAWGLALTGIWGSTVGYALLALATGAAGFAPAAGATLQLRLPALPGRKAGRATAGAPDGPQALPAPGDLLILVLGATAAVNGALLLALPGAFQASSYDAVRAQAALYGLALLAAGSALLYCHLGGAVPRRAYLAVHTLAAALFLAWAAVVMVPIRAWTGIVFYAGFGALVGILPWQRWLEVRSRAAVTARTTSTSGGASPGPAGATISSLRARLALALAGAAAIPLILAAVVISRQEGQAAVDEALVQQQTMAGVLAQDAGQYIGLHRSAVAALAGQVPLLEPDPAAQTALLRAVGEAYPAFVFLGTFDAEGRGLTRGQGRPPPPSARFPIFDEVRRSGSPVIDVLNRPELAQGPVFAIAAPVFQGERFAGVVLGAVEATQLSDVLARPRVGVAGETYLVDGRGRAVAHPDMALVAQLADLSALPPVAAVLGADGDAQSLRYRGWSGERLAGAARVPGLGWGIVVERPISTVLANSYARRDIIFVVLVLAIGAAAGAGVLAASKLTRSLAVLADAADALAAEQADVRLPRSSTAEVARLAGAFGAMRDRLAARTAEREEAIRLRDNVLATVSHDLRNPLTTIALRAHLLQDEATELLQAEEAGEGVAQDERMERLAGMTDGAGRIVSSTAKMQSMIDELVDTARLHSGQRLDLRRTPTDLVQLARHLAEEYRQTAVRHRIRLELGADEVIGVWDQARLDRLLHNLLGNAVKYSPNGGEVTITVGREATPDGRQWATLAVRDQGVGIPAPDLPYVFDRYRRAANVVGRIRGTGLGLSSARQVVEQHGGTLDVVSSEGEGSTFTVRLPLSAPDVPAPAPTGAGPPPAATSPETGVAPGTPVAASGTREARGG